MKKKKALLLFLLCLFPALSSLQAYWVWSPEAGKFVNSEGGAQSQADEDYDYAMRFYKDKNYDQAAEQLQNILKKSPNSRIAPEAQYRLGTIYEEKGDFLKAFKAYRVVVEQYPQSERFNEVIEREFKIGNLFLAGKKAKLAGLEILPSLPRAAEVFNHILKYAPFSAFGDKAQFHLGLTYKKWGHFEEAVQAFQTVLDNYPQSELAPQARFQLAETSFARSAAQYRDQRALDDASKQVDRFLSHYPDSNTSEKATKIRQMIDEKNAEKNYRVGLYYEKDNYLQSALIYYSDVAKQYPNTQWGQKAKEKLQTLKNPADYISAQEKQVSTEIQQVQEELKKQTDKKSVESEGLKRRLELLEKRQKNVGKSKKESMERRQQDLARRQREFKEKVKNLEQKKKLLAKNPSEDFKRAIDRWQASLNEEQEALFTERDQLKGLRDELGLPEKKNNLEFLPFVGEVSELDRVRRVEAKKLYKLSEEKKGLLEEKELLYKQHDDVATQLKNWNAEQSQPAVPVVLDEQTVAAKETEIKTLAGEVAQLEKQFDERKKAYEARFGKTEGLVSWVKKPVEVMGASGQAVVQSIDKSVGVLNPFSKEAPTREQLLERRNHLKEKVAAQERIVQTLSQAFDEQLAFRERQRMIADLEKEAKQDPRELRKSMKTLEKQIRGGYEEIEDRHEKKKGLLNQLDGLLKQKKEEETAWEKTGRKITAPARGTYRFFHAFLFGMKPKEVAVTESAEKVAAKAETSAADIEVIRKLREEIELESLMIDAKSKEIITQQKQLEILKAKASLAGGYKFRPVLIRVPYLFIDEAIDSAKRLVPKKNREEYILGRMNDETQKLESQKAELKDLDAQLNALKQPQAPTIAAEEVQAVEPDESTLEREKIAKVASELAVKKTAYENAKRELDNAREGSKEKSQQVQKIQREHQALIKGQAEKLQSELKNIEQEILQSIDKETQLETEEKAILEKRIQKVDERMKKINSKFESKDLLTEREKMEARLSEIQSRQDALAKEKSRFAATNAAAAA